MTIRERLTNWLAGEDVGNLRRHHTQAMENNAYLRGQLNDLRRRVGDRAAGVLPYAPYGRLPDATFVGIHDYGKGVTREEALTFARVDVPKAGVSVKVDKEWTVTVSRDGVPIVILPAKP